MAEKDTEKKETEAKPKAEPAAKKPAAKPKAEPASKKPADAGKPAAKPKAEPAAKKPAAKPKAEPASTEPSAAEKPKTSDATDKPAAPRKPAAAEKPAAKSTAKSAGKLKITLVKSLAGRHDKHIATAKSLGLKKIGAVTFQPDNPQTRGKISQIKYLVTVTEDK